MSAPLVGVEIPSIYPVGEAKKVNVPGRMARCTPDMRKALLLIKNDVKAAGGVFLLSDLFRSYEMQLQAHLDYKSGKKSAYSPPPGGSMHESGRAFDVDVASLKITLAKFWEIAAKYGVVPIISKPNTSEKECWHFECRGSHEKVRQYYQAGRGKNMTAAQAMAASAIVGCGVQVDRFKNQTAAAIQSALIRLGHDIGDIDGAIGSRSKAAIQACNVPISDDLAKVLAGLEELLQAQFPAEYDTSGVSFSTPDYSEEAVFWEYDEPGREEREQGGD